MVENQEQFGQIAWLLKQDVYPIDIDTLLSSNAKMFLLRAMRVVHPDKINSNSSDKQTLNDEFLALKQIYEEWYQKQIKPLLDSDNVDELANVKARINDYCHQHSDPDPDTVMTCGEERVDAPLICHALAIQPNPQQMVVHKPPDSKKKQQHHVPVTNGCHREQLLTAIKIIEDYPDRCSKLLWAWTQWGKTETMMEVAARVLLSKDADQVVIINGANDISQRQDFDNKKKSSFDTTKIMTRGREALQNFKNATEEDKQNKKDTLMKWKGILKLYNSINSITDSDILLICFLNDLINDTNGTKKLPLQLDKKILFIWDEAHFAERKECVIYKFLEKYNLHNHLTTADRGSLPPKVAQHQFLFVSATPESLRFNTQHAAQAIGVSNEDATSGGALQLTNTTRASVIPEIKGIVGEKYFGHYDQCKNGQYLSYSADDLSADDLVEILTREITRMVSTRDDSDDSDDSDFSDYPDYSDSDGEFFRSLNVKPKKSVDHPKYIIIYGSGTTRNKAIENFATHSPYKIKVTRMDSTSTSHFRPNDLCRKPDCATIVLVMNMLGMGTTLATKEFLHAMIITSSTAQGTSTVQRTGRGTGYPADENERTYYSTINYYVPERVLPELTRYAHAQKNDVDNHHDSSFLTSTTMRHNKMKDVTRAYKPCVPIAIQPLNDENYSIVEDLFNQCFTKKVKGKKKLQQDLWYSISQMILENQDSLLSYQRPEQRDKIVEILRRVDAQKQCLGSTSGKSSASVDTSIEPIEPSVILCNVLSRKAAKNTALEPTITNKDILYALDEKHSTYINNPKTYFTALPDKCHKKKATDGTEQHCPFTVIIVSPEVNKVTLKTPLPAWTNFYSIIVLMATDYNNETCHHFRGEVVYGSTQEEVWSACQNPAKKRKMKNTTTPGKGGPSSM